MKIVFFLLLFFIKEVYIQNNQRVPPNKQFLHHSCINTVSPSLRVPGTHLPHLVPGCSRGILRKAATDFD